jgi:hypothetical protein
VPLLDFNPSREIRDDLYRHVIEVALARGLSYALLVVRDEGRLADSAIAVLSGLEPYLTESRQASSWPGTHLAYHTATVNRYELNRSVADQVVAAAAGLFDWVEPALPEDLCILRSDGSPWLTTVAHERDGYFTLTDREREQLLHDLPQLAG